MSTEYTTDIARVGSGVWFGVRERTNRRNAHGVKASCDCYRTIKGHEYHAWMSCPSADRIAAYRAAGVRFRLLGSKHNIAGHTPKERSSGGCV